MGIDRKKLVSFVKRQLIIDEDDGAVCVKLVLRHAAGKGAPVSMHAVRSGISSAEDIAAEVIEGANNDAEGLGGLQKYILCAYFSDDVEAVRSRFAFRVMIEDDSEEGFETEGPDAKGLVSQSMRHNEALMRTATMGFHEVLRAQNGIIEKLSSMNERLLGTHVEMIESLDALRARNAEREMIATESTARMEREQQIVGKIVALLPAVANRFMGSKVLPQDATPETMMIDKVLGDLTPEQMATIMGALSTEQKMLVMELYQSGKKRYEEEQKGKKNGGSPETH